MSGGHRTTSTEEIRLRQICVDLRRRGYKVREIAEALGLSQSTVSNYLIKAGLRGFLPHYVQDLPRLQPIPWLDSEQPPAPERPLSKGYELSLAVRAVANSLRHLREVNAVFRLAHDVADALDESDEAWVATTRASLDDLQGYLRRMIQVIDDPEVRERVRVDHRERDDISRPVLRRVGT